MRVFCVVGFKDGFCGTLNKTHSHIGRYTHTHTYGIQHTLQLYSYPSILLIHRKMLLTVALRFSDLFYSLSFSCMSSLLHHLLL